MININNPILVDFHRQQLEELRDMFIQVQLNLKCEYANSKMSFFEFKTKEALNIEEYASRRAYHLNELLMMGATNY